MTQGAWIRIYIIFKGHLPSEGAEKSKQPLLYIIIYISIHGYGNTVLWRDIIHGVLCPPEIQTNTNKKPQVQLL